MGQGALPSPGNVIKCTLQFTETGGLTYGSHFYLGYTGGPVTSADAGTIATNMRAGWLLGMPAHFPSTVTLVSCKTQDLSSNTGVVQVNTTPAASTGGGNAVESGVSICVRFLTAAHYRGGHPKIFLPPGMTTDVVQPSSWSGTLQSAIVTGWNQMISQIMSSVLSSCALSGQVAVSWFKGPITNTDPSPWAPKNVPKLRPTPVVLPVQSIQVTPLIASQRRRRQSTGA